MLAGMMDYGYSGAGAALQGAEVAEQLGHGTRLILIQTVKSNQWIENEKHGAMEPDRGRKFFAILAAIEAERIGGDDPDIHLIEIQRMVARQGVKPRVQCRHGLFGRIQ